MSGTHFIVYAARHGAKSFFEGISDPTFFSTINKILDDGYYREYEDPRHGETFRFESLRDFVVHPEGLDIPDWLPFMKALQAQDEGTSAKTLYKRMLELDDRLDPLVGFSEAAQPLAPARRPTTEEAKQKVDNVHLRPARQLNSNSQERILRRIARDCPELLNDIGKNKRFKSARAAAIEAGIIKDIPSIQLKDPGPTAQKLLAKKGQSWCLQLIEELSELVL